MRTQTCCRLVLWISVFCVVIPHGRNATLGWPTEPPVETGKPFSATDNLLGGAVEPDQLLAD
jgi:hypothetical protein